MSIEKVVERFYEAHNARDAAAVAALYARDASHEEIAQRKVKQGPKEIATGLERFFGWFPDASWTPERRAVGANGVAMMSYLLKATLKSHGTDRAARAGDFTSRRAFVGNPRRPHSPERGLLGCRYFSTSTQPCLTENRNEKRE
ncbi:ketosteroid isomerase-like protein [Bradyrhizobium elkanii]|nr:ketosteroid isomerase-like protein [Bradyrhizobium elkanii]